jgi:hypothetical protein
MLFPKAETVVGELDKKVFDVFFKTDYVMIGERLRFPANSLIAGALVASDGKSVVTLPIAYWITPDGGKTYLCQGTSKDGKAPSFSAFARSPEALIKTIKEWLAGRPSGKHRLLQEREEGSGVVPGRP